MHMLNKPDNLYDLFTDKVNTEAQAFCVQFGGFKNTKQFCLLKEITKYPFLGISANSES